jgi:hypothetical protein
MGARQLQLDKPAPRPLEWNGIRAWNAMKRRQRSRGQQLYISHRSTGADGCGDRSWTSRAFDLRSSSCST